MQSLLSRRQKAVFRASAQRFRTRADNNISAEGNLRPQRSANARQWTQAQPSGSAAGKNTETTCGSGQVRLSAPARFLLRPPSIPPPQGNTAHAVKFRPSATNALPEKHLRHPSVPPAAARAKTKVLTVFTKVRIEISKVPTVFSKVLTVFRDHPGPENHAGGQHSGPPHDKKKEPFRFRKGPSVRYYSSTAAEAPLNGKSGSSPLSFRSGIPQTQGFVSEFAPDYEIEIPRKRPLHLSLIIHHSDFPFAIVVLILYFYSIFFQFQREKLFDFYSKWNILKRTTGLSNPKNSRASRSDQLRGPFFALFCSS